MLNKLQDTLKNWAKEKELAGVYYGACRAQDLDAWNYLVFDKKKITKSGTSGRDYSEYYEVHIVHEDYIPESFVYDLVREIEKECTDENKLKQANVDVEYNYTLKNNTNMVVELATITFVHALKAER